MNVGSDGLVLRVARDLADRSKDIIELVCADPPAHRSVIFECRGVFGVPTMTYAGVPRARRGSASSAAQALIWQDLDQDGRFDVRMDMRLPELSIRLAGSPWVKATFHGFAKDVVVTDDGFYHFDIKTGNWLPAAQPPAQEASTRDEALRFFEDHLGDDIEQQAPSTQPQPGGQDEKPAESLAQRWGLSGGRVGREVSMDMRVGDQGLHLGIIRNPADPSRDTVCLIYLEGDRKGLLPVSFDCRGTFNVAEVSYAGVPRERSKDTGFPETRSIDSVDLDQDGRFDVRFDFQARRVSIRRASDQWEKARFCGGVSGVACTDEGGFYKFDLDSGDWLTTDRPATKEVLPDETPAP
jgi:hypothetical protein